MSKVLPIKINHCPVPTVKDPCILGVTLDPMLTFRSHATKLKEKITKRTNILKALARTTWGKEEETLLTTNKAIWTPALCESAWDDLQAGQNAALRVATGCVKMTAASHLHSESKVMPVKDHCEMLSQQFLLSTTQANHPNHTTSRPRHLDS